MNNDNNRTTAIPNTYRQLFRLENMDDWKVHHDDTDIRGYECYTVDGKRIGEVENLLVDKSIEKVRYVEIELEEGIPMVNADAAGSYTERDGDRIIIVPVGLVDIKDNKTVNVHGLSATDFRNYPRYRRGDNLTPAYETSVYSYLSGNDYVGAPGKTTATTSGSTVDASRVTENTVNSSSGVDFDRSVYDGPRFRRSTYRREALRTSMTGTV